MTLAPLFLTIVVTYFVLIAYRMVGLHRRRVTGAARWVAAALLVIAPPALIAGGLLLAGEPAFVREWRWSLLAMPVAGALIALLAGLIAARVTP